MENFALIIILLIACFVSGPIALIKIVSLSRKMKELYRHLGISDKGYGFFPLEEAKGPAKAAEVVIPKKFSQEKPVPETIETVEDKQAIKPQPPVKEQVGLGAKEIRPEVCTKGEKELIRARELIKDQQINHKDISLEQQIGTRWILIAGVITVFVGVGFFLKYAYENFAIGPLGRVTAVIIAGLVALVVGEITRRRGYDIVAKGVTALGFGMLYAAVFAAYYFYHLIDTTPAFVLAIIITIAAMFYAVVLDEILIAFLSLLGGFLTPVIVSTGENLPIPLFTYTSILGIGAMLCAYFKNWRAVNFLAFAGTFVLYTGWFETFYHTGGANKQMPIALGWLSVFFVVYLVVPILYELINQVKTHKEDVMLILVNAGIGLYYFCRILFDSYRAELAFCAVGLSVIHLIMMAVAARRCKDDRNLQVVLLAIGLFFITIAIPLYLKMYAIPMAWATEGLILAIIGLRYRSEWIQAGSVIPLCLSAIKLILNLPLHTGPFGLVFNPEFGTWCFVAAIIGVYHLIYRRTSESTEEVRGTVAQVMYAAMGLLLFAAATMEWYWHCHYNLMVEVSIHYISRGQLIIFAGIVLLFAIRPVCPKGLLSEALSLIIVAGGTIFTLIALFYLHDDVFVIFANLDFIVVLLFVSAMLVCHIKYRQFSESDQEQRGMISQIIYGVLGVLLLLTVAAEWYWHCKVNLSLNYMQSPVLKGQVIIFALVMLLFVTRPICPRGIIPKVMALLIGGVGAMFTMAALAYFYRDSFAIFANAEFGIVLLFVAAIFTAAWLLNLRVKEEPLSQIFAVVFIIAGIFVLWVLLTEQIYLYWNCRNKYAAAVDNWKFLAHMYISVMWAVYGAALMIIGFWRNFGMLRYIAIALFGLLLLKVFIWDTRTIENVYRIAAFMATGITLVGVSYLYQFLKKKGFFEALVIEDN